MILPRRDVCVYVWRMYVVKRSSFVLYCFWKKKVLLRLQRESGGSFWKPNAGFKTWFNYLTSGSAMYSIVAIGFVLCDIIPGGTRFSIDT